MKKMMLTAFIAGITGLSINAQTSFGVKTGMNFAIIAAEYSNDYKSKIGYTICAFAEIDISETISLQPQLLFSAQGAKYEDTRPNSPLVGLPTDLKANYIILPIMLKYSATEKINIEAGPQIGLLLAAEIYDTDYKDQVESIDFGANFGISYDFSDVLFAQARYNLGLTNLLKDSAEDKVKNSVLSISFGYKFI